MPYLITGFDSAGVPCAVNVSDEGIVSGDALLNDWLTANPVPDPPEGDPPHVSGQPLSDARLEQIRQHVSRLLTYTTIAAPPPEVPLARDREASPTAPAAGRHPSPSPTPGHRHTTAELEAMTVTDLRSLAVPAQIAGASTMTKAELVTALQAHQRSGSAR